MKVFVMTCSLLSLGGCVGMRADQRVQEAQREVRAEASQSPGYDYAVHVRTVVDAGHIPDDQATRNATALGFLGPRCARPRIVGETVLATATSLMSRSSQSYSVLVKCA